MQNPQLQGAATRSPQPLQGLARKHCNESMNPLFLQNHVASEKLRTQPAQEQRISHERG